jgi:hypothetical protein
VVEQSPADDRGFLSWQRLFHQRGIHTVDANHPAVDFAQFTHQPRALTPDGDQQAVVD